MAKDKKAIVKRTRKAAGTASERTGDQSIQMNFPERTMTMTKSNPVMKTLMPICAGGMLLLTLASCTTAGADDYGDRRRCSGSRDRYDCMSMQQHRRDREQLINQEKALINAEQARENLRMLREIRRRRGEY
ncbi:hypothetical protein [Pararhizobium sp.]|uniref:hypothetical protein n=1 Tax=Pararhizobium sp. TaxID=1977563 RepID=UPI003BAAB78E